jgi:hypothetical protein
MSGPWGSGPRGGRGGSGGDGGPGGGGPWGGGRGGGGDGRNGDGSGGGSPPPGLRITAELTDAVTGEHIWTDRFDLAVRDPLAMERDAIMRLVPPLHAHLLAADGRPPQPPPPLLMLANGAGAAEATVVMHPRGTPLASNVPSAPAAQAVPLLIEPVPMIAPSHHKAMAVLRRFIKVIVIGIVGLFAFIMVDEHRGWVIEVAAWMLVAFGFVQMVGALVEAPPEG